MTDEERLSRIHDRLDGISKDVATILATCPGCREQVRENTKALRGGNGDGVYTRLTRVEDRIASLTEDTRRQPGDPVGITFSLRGAAGWQTTLKLIAAIGILFGLPALGSYVGQGVAQGVSQQPAAETNTDHEQ